MKGCSAVALLRKSVLFCAHALKLVQADILSNVHLIFQHAMVWSAYHDVKHTERWLDERPSMSISRCASRLLSKKSLSWSWISQVGNFHKQSVHLLQVTQRTAADQAEAATGARKEERISNPHSTNAPVQADSAAQLSTSASEKPPAGVAEPLNSASEKLPGAIAEPQKGASGELPSAPGNEQQLEPSGSSRASSDKENQDANEAAADPPSPAAAAGPVPPVRRSWSGAFAKIGSLLKPSTHDAAKRRSTERSSQESIGSDGQQAGKGVAGTLGADKDSASGAVPNPASMPRDTRPTDMTTVPHCRCSSLAQAARAEKYQIIKPHIYARPVRV
jgi:hypothetical protein